MSNWIGIINGVANGNIKSNQISTSQRLMAGLALGKWTKLFAKDWINDPIGAYMDRLNESQRKAIEEWRRTH